MDNKDMNLDKNYNKEESHGALEIDLWELVIYFLSKWYWFLAAGLIVGITVFMVSAFMISPKYQSVITLNVENRREGVSSDNVNVNSGDIAAAESLAETYKVILSSNIAFGVTMDKTTVPVAGIRNIKAEDVENFKAHGYVCKLISTGKRTEKGFAAYVQPTLVKEGEPEAAVPMNYNLITFIGETSERMSFYGQGAGRYPTAYNVVQDLVDVLQGKGFYAPYGEKVAADNSEKLSWYVRGNWTGEKVENWREAVVTEAVSVSDMHAWLKENPEAFVAAIRA